MFKLFSFLRYTDILRHIVEAQPNVLTYVSSFHKYFDMHRFPWYIFVRYCRWAVVLRGASQILLFTQCCYINEIKYSDNEEACSAHGDTRNTKKKYSQSDKLKGSSPLEHHGIDGRVIFKCVLMKYNVRVWPGVFCSVSS